MSEEAKYLSKAKETYYFHRSKLLSNDKWTVAQTAKSLKRSLGSISEDLLIARCYRLYKKQMERFDFAYQAIEYIREQQKKSDLEDL